MKDTRKIFVEAIETALKFSDKKKDFFTNYTLLVLEPLSDVEPVVFQE